MSEAADAKKPASAPAPTNIVVEYVQTGEGVPEGGKTGRLSMRERTLDPKMHLTCANPACKKGGFLLRAKVDAAVTAGKSELEATIACAGYVGSLRSETNPSAGCPNRLAVKVTLGTAKAAAKPDGPNG